MAFIVVVLAVLLGGGWYFSQTREAAAKVAAAQKAEREWLVKQRSLIKAYEINLKRAQDELETVISDNSKPARKNGKPVAQSKWSSEAEQRYERARKEVNRIITARDESVTEFNKRLNAYKGPWPVGEQQLAPIPVPDMP